MAAKKMLISRRMRLGDIVELTTSKGYAYAQYVNHVLLEDITGIRELEEFFRAALNSAET